MPGMKDSDSLSGLSAASEPDADDVEYTGKFAEQGTAVSGFVSTGKQYCGDCIHVSNGACYHPAVMRDPDLPAMPDGTAAKKRKQADGGIKVDIEKECCRYVNKEE